MSNKETKSKAKFNIKSLFNKLFIIHAVAFVIVGFAFYKVANKYSFVTVTGTSTNKETNQIASFNVTVEKSNENKQKAVIEVSDIADQIVQDLKEFGIPSEDVQTTCLNVYQREIYRDNGEYEMGDWYASYSVEIKLRDLTKSTGLTAMLASYENTTMWGPNMTIDYQNIDEETLLQNAIDDARQKAKAMALKSNRKLGKVLNVSEGYNYIYPPMYRGIDVAMEGAGGAGFPIEPGTSDTSRTVTVTFRLW